ncbi:hypothetical protein DFH06DRAFT_1475222 [Mycena polygramma]|nr:hypothetical protein DFH06DRAFT_1475222 [Mycena polygramma]
MSKRVKGLWFPNESPVVLRAGESSFRVTKSVLAAHSPTFQAMFAASDGYMTDDEEEIIDGSPVIILDDDPTEVEPFLRAIFDSSYFMPPPASVEFEAVLGILRLSHKYDVGYLRKRAVCHLETVYPVQLTQVGGFNGGNVAYDSALADMDLVAIPILHEVGAVWLLPFAYYNLASFPIGTLLDPSCTGEWAGFPSEMKQTCLLVQACNLEATDRIYEACAPSLIVRRAMRATRQNSGF